MANVLAGLSNGRWLTRERVMIVAGITLAVTVLVLGFLAVTARSDVDILGRPVGTDFASFYAAGKAALAGEPGAPYDPARQHAEEQALFGAATPFYAWQYPPFFLLLAAPLAALPYALALFVWQAATLGFCLLVVRAIFLATGAPLDRLWWLPVVGAPAVFVNCGHGQNGFLSAALVGAGLVQLDRRPWLAGICFGLLAYKPQLALLIPVVLLATGRWRAIAAGVATVAVLALAVTALFGASVWQAFHASTAMTRTDLLENGGPGWEKIVTVFAWLRMWGGSVALAYAAQALATLAIAAALVWLWRSHARPGLKAAALVIAAVAAAPFSLDYDMTVTGIAVAFLAADGIAAGFAPWQKTALAALWLAPLFARSAGSAHIPLGIIVMLAALAVVVHSALDRRFIGGTINPR